MKKRLLLLCCITMLALTGCGKKEAAIEPNVIISEPYANTITEPGTYEYNSVLFNTIKVNEDVIKLTNKDNYLVDTFSINDEKYNLGTGFYVGNSYIRVKEDGTYWILIGYGTDVEWNKTKPVYVNKNHEVTLFDSISGRVSDINDITDNSFVIENQVNILGTHAYQVTMLMSENGVTKESDYIEFTKVYGYEDGTYFDGVSDISKLSLYRDEYGRSILTLKSNLKVTSNGTDFTQFAPGEKLVIKGYNPENSKFYVEHDGNEYYFTYEYKDNVYYIDGASENDLFEVVKYIG